MGEYVHGDFGTVTVLNNKSKNVLKTGPLMHAFPLNTKCVKVLHMHWACTFELYCK